MRVKVYFAAVVLLIALNAPAWSEVRFIDRPSSGEEGRIAGHPHLRFTGKISAVDTFVLMRLLGKAIERSELRFDGRPQLLVFLDSAGGEVDAAMWIGRKLRDAHAFVVVDRHAECSSACVLLLAAGVNRLVVPTARIGLHRPQFQDSYYRGRSPADARQQYRALEDSLKKYLTEMGMPDALFEEIRSIPKHKVVFLRPNELIRLGLNRHDASEEHKRAGSPNDSRREMRSIHRLH
jgi:hypothetical protein